MSRFKFNIGLKFKILFPVLTGIILLLAINIYSRFKSFNETLIKNVNTEISGINKTFNGLVDENLNALKKAVELVASNQEYAKYAAEGNREALLKVLGNYYKNIKQDIRQFQFHTKDAKTILRFHKPEHFGDDLSSFRKTVVKANHIKAPVLGLEVGVGGPGLRVVYPVFYNGEHVGSVEFGGEIDSILEKIQKHYAIDYAVGIKEDAFVKAKRKDSDKDIKKSGIVYYTYRGELIKDILNAYVSDNFYTIKGSKFYIAKIALKDFSGEDIGHILVAKNYTQYINEALAQFYTSITIMILLGILIIVALLISVHTIIKTIKNFHEIARELAQGEGDFSKRIPQKYADFTKVTGIKDENILNKLSNKPCWVSIGDFAVERICPLLKDGKVSCCEDCRMFNAHCSDEVCQMTTWFNIFLETTERSFLNIMKKITGVVESAPIMWQSVYRVTEANDKNTEMAIQTATAGEEMSSTIHEISNGVDEMTNKSNKTQNLALEGSSLVAESTTYSDEVQNAITKLKDNIKELINNANKIGAVVGVINDISEQTNLLALNAAIEAARAGEHGRGFAVVADEVRKLAEKTQKSTKEIEHMIREMQFKVKNVGKDVENSSASVQKQYEIAQKTQDGFNVILSSIEELNHTIISISKALEEQTKATSEIAQSMTTISESSSHTKTIMSDLTGKIQTLLSEASNVVSMLNSYKYSAKGVAFIKAKLAHIEFMNRLYDAIVFRKTYEVVDHRHCNFGMFYYSDGIKEFGHDYDFKAIEPYHIKVHELGRKAMECIKTGRFDLAFETMKEMEQPLQTLKKHLDNLINRYM
ncbi:MAG: methyl-accepting chemotaxis protein [Calditerrivibrio sp.]|nr:methyl-accepting chemotaxis protein [Calditerrivibrio sp.]